MSSIYSTNFYVYAYLRNDGTPYYIGKGTGDRAWNKNHFSKPSDKSRIILVEQNLTEIGAFAIERKLIRWYGRKDIGTGILRNLSNGGEGPSGAKRSEETRKKISEGQKGIKNHNYGKSPSYEYRQKISKAMIGIKRTEETKRKLKENITCCLCGTMVTKLVHNRWHGKKCKYKKQ
jgi:hypothetical protein